MQMCNISENEIENRTIDQPISEFLVLWETQSAAAAGLVQLKMNCTRWMAEHAYVCAYEFVFFSE